MYNVIEEFYEKPIKEDSYFYPFDEVNTNMCPCQQENTVLEFTIPYVTMRFHWKHKQLTYMGDSGGGTFIKYCPFCGRKL